LTADAQTPTNQAASSQGFETHASPLLHLMVHSVYSNREFAELHGRRIARVGAHDVG
jgi:hypothetical protein